MIPLYDSTSYRNKPSTPLPGMLGIRCTGNEFLAGTYPNLDRENPNEAGAKAVARDCWEKRIPLVVNIEHWNIDIRTTTTTIAIANLRKLARIFDWCHEAAPSLRVGMYAFMPMRSYWERIDGRDGLWRAANDFIAERLVKHVDVLYPSLYTFYDDVSGWQAYAEDNIAEARRIARGRDVVPFLWPEYHNSNAKLGGQPIPEAFWATQLRTMRNLADGLVVWGGWQQEWDEQAEWLRIAREVLAGEVI